MTEPSPPHPRTGGASGAASGAASDPSMEDILASIRRILSEDDAQAGAAPAAAAPPPAAPPSGTPPSGTPPSGTPPSGTPPRATPPSATPPVAAPPVAAPSRTAHALSPGGRSGPTGGPDDILMLDNSMMVSDPYESSGHHDASAAPVDVPLAGEPVPSARQPPHPAEPPMPMAVPAVHDNTLVAPEAAAAAASAVDNLVRTLAAGRSTAIHRGGPTIEDLVREEIRPVIKAWLDAHLPDMVQRMVRAEIERVVSRAAG